ncbi:hypothetical protein BDV10DRAFT_65608 [Aspergillus recurvatus]
MTRYPALWSAYLSSLLLLPRARAWTLIWRNGTTRSSVEDGQSAQNCTQIWHQKDEEFSWDPEGPWCLKFYSDPTCENSNGITCEGYRWKQPASQNISAFSVYPMPPSSVTAFGFASSAAVPTTASTVTPTPTDTDADETETPVAEAVSSDGDNSKLSAGAIAGIAVGAVFAVALLCAAFFYLGRRSRRKAANAAAAAATALPRSDSPSASAAPLDTSSSMNPSSSPSNDVSSSPVLAVPGPMIAELPKPPTVEIQRVPPPADQAHPPNGTRMIELPGQILEVELSNSRQVQEMDISRQIQELEGHGMEKREL